MLTCAAPVPVQSEPLATRDPLIVAVPRLAPPSYATDEQGRPIGFAIEVMDEVANRAGLRVRYLVRESIRGVQEALANGDADLIPSLGADETREKAFDFTRPIEAVAVSIFVRRDSAGIRTGDDLAGRRVGATTGSLGLRWIAERRALVAVNYRGVTDALFGLLSGDVEAIVVTESTIWKLASEARIADRIRALHPPLFEVKRAIAVRDGNPALLARLDAAVAEFLKTPRYREIYLKWHAQPAPFWTASLVARLMGAVVLVLLLAMGGWHYLAVVRGNRALARQNRERERAEAELRVSEEKFRNLAEGSIQGMLVHSRNRILFANPAAARIFGFASAGELIGRARLELIAPQDRERLNEYGRRRFRGEDVAPSYAYLGLRADGTTIWLENVVRRVTWEGQPALQTTIVDISERKRAEEASHVSEEKYRRLVEGSIQGIRITQDGFVVFSNQAFAEMFGYGSPAEVVGRPTGDFSAPFEHPRLLAYRAARRSGGEVPARYEFQGVRKDGSPIWLENRVSPMTWEGRPANHSAIVDITDRKRAEEELRLSEEKYRLLVEGSIQGIRIIQDSIVVFCNQAYAEMFGYATPAETIGRTTLEFAAPAEHARLRGYSQARRSGGEAPTRYEYQGVRKDGSAIWVENRVSPMTWLGRPANHSAIVDITERKRAEEELRRSEEKFRNLVEGSIQGYVILQQGRIAFANAAYANIYGYDSPADMLGRDPLDFLVAQGDRDRLRSNRQAVQEGQSPPQYNAYQGLRRDGTQLWLGSLAQRVEWQGGPAVQVTLVDISEQRRAEEERARLATAVEQSDECIFITSPEGRIQYVNPAFERITGYTREEALGQRPDLLGGEHQDTAFYGILWAALAKGEAWSGQVVNRRRDGTLYHTVASMTPLRDPNGRIISILAVQRDVTQQLEMETRLRRAQRLEALGTLAGSIAHDFRNLLQPIAGYAELALESLAPEHQARPLVGQVHKAALRARELVEEILLVGRKADGRRELLRLGRVVEEVTAQLRPSVPPQVRLRIDVASDAPPVPADAIQLNRLLMNLCLNAIQAMPLGGELGVTLRRVVLAGIPVYMHRLTGATVSLAVSDTGIGMDTETQDRLFEPFFSRKQHVQGTGLGLASVFGIVVQHGAYIQVQSALGQGTTVSVYFPLEGCLAEPLVGKATLSTAPPKVLLVDDDFSAASFAAVALHQAGYHVSLQTDSRLAIEAFRAQPDGFVAVVTDMRMPRLDGAAFLQAIRAIRPAVPVILMTAYPELAQGRARELGFDECVLKPVAAERLVQIVVRAIAGPAPQPARPAAGDDAALQPGGTPRRPPSRPLDS
ncbi:MAG: PAS domain S-box protein [Candidatus Lambdaproteobacteria bacterium]|nr:PAS domain S-box protein [Candidatus Lambdaproteobacteria bacterium]